MTSHTPTPEGKDPVLWQIAQNRAAFRSHLVTYLVINAFLWILWFFRGADNMRNGLPWPAWASFGWGIGLVFHYINAYVSTGNAVEKEYEKLISKK